MDLLSTDYEHRVEITIGTNLSETNLNEEQMRLLDKNDEEIYAIRLRIPLSQMYLSMNNDPKAIRHLN